MSSSVRDITESTEAEGRDDTHHRDRWIRTVGISPPLPLRPAPCMSCRVEASAEAGGGAGTSGCAGVRDAGDTAQSVDCC